MEDDFIDCHDAIVMIESYSSLKLKIEEKDKQIEFLMNQLSKSSESHRSDAKDLETFHQKKEL